MRQPGSCSKRERLNSCHLERGEKKKKEESYRNYYPFSCGQQLFSISCCLWNLI